LGRTQEDVLPVLGQCVAEHVSRSRTLLELEIGVDFGASAMGALGHAIGASQSLRVVSFRDSEMGDSSFSALVAGVRKNDVVGEINFSGCRLSDASDAAVASVIRARVSRRAVEAWENTLRNDDVGNRRDGFSDEGIPNPVRPELGLRALDLSHNDLGPAATRAMCSALRQDVELRSLGMRACRVTDEDAARLGEVMKEHVALETVELFQSRAPGADLGTLRVADRIESTATANRDARSHRDEARDSRNAMSRANDAFDGARALRDVYMDMEWVPNTPRSKIEAEKRSVAARAASRPASASARPNREKNAFRAIPLQHERVFCPASGATANKWSDMGTHSSAARPRFLGPQSPRTSRTVPPPRARRFREFSLRL
jgi:hypothetical protein